VDPVHTADTARAARGPEALRAPRTAARLHLRAALLAALLLAPACAVNPVTGEREVIFVSEEQERRLGREGAEQVAAQMGIFADPALTTYVAAVGARVAARSPRHGVEWHFEIVDQAAPNAFALPDGHLYVSRGLVELANSEDELAAVMAHEVVHVAARHHAQQQTRATGVGLLALPGLLAGAVIGGPLGEVVQVPILVLGSGLVASYGRDQEREADEIGQRLAAEAGYDPGALASYLVTLEAWTAHEQKAHREPGFFDTHPSTPERASSARARAHAARLAAARTPGIARDRAAFLARIDGLLVGENPAEGIFEGPLFVHPDLGFSLRFPDGWKTANTRTAVGAVAGDRRATTTLRAQAEGSDPRAVAKQSLEATARETRLDLLRAGEVEIGGRRAFQALAVAATPRGAVTLHLTWIAHEGVVYLLAGVVEGGYAQSHHAALEATAASFRPLDAEQRARIRETRLRIARAGAGETLAIVSRRSGSAWEPGYAEIVNAVGATTPLPAGAPLKIARREPYTGAAAPAR
jgi:predicted Zn-dependent protease